MLKFSHIRILHLRVSSGIICDFVNSPNKLSKEGIPVEISNWLFDKDDLVPTNAICLFADLFWKLLKLLIPLPDMLYYYYYYICLCLLSISIDYLFTECKQSTGK